MSEVQTEKFLNLGVPDCRVQQAGAIGIFIAGRPEGAVYPLPGPAAGDAAVIAECLKDALVAAVINKSCFRLKLADTKNNRGEIVETALQAVYERADMTPVRIWVNGNRGDVGALAAALRKALAERVPELNGPGL